jgi:hypothetical protein
VNCVGSGTILIHIPIYTCICKPEKNEQEKNTETFLAINIASQYDWAV